MGFNIRLEFLLPVSPAKVMDLLLDPVMIRKWSGGEAMVDKKEGGAVSMYDGWMTGTITKLKENELAYTWKTTDWAADAAYSEVNYKLTKDKEGTKVLVEHTNLPSQEEADYHTEGWDEQFFGPMEEYLWTTIKD